MDQLVKRKCEIVKQLTIEDMKAIELEIMDEIDRICCLHGVQYFLGYGSLLGAVRHGGFIPWDDDMDVVMMRDQYELLMKHFNEWRSTDRFKLVSYRDKSSIYQFAKIVDTTTVVYESFVGKKAATGVWVDIFPLEHFTQQAAGLLKQHKRVGLLRSFAVTDPSTGTNGFVKLVKRIVCPFVKNQDPYELARRLDDIAISVNESSISSDCVIDVLGEGRPDKTYPKNLFLPIRMKFENREYYAPSGYEKFLAIEYGDWRTPPADSARLVHVMEAYRL